MSTPNTDVENEQNASQGATGTIYNEDTLQLRTASPPPTAPQPPRHTDHNRRNFWLAIAAVVIVLALVFSVFAIFIAQPGKQTASQTTPTTTPGTTVTTPGTDTTPAPVPGATQGPQNGPSGANTTAYWDNILGTKGTNSKVESVSFANVMGNSSLQALVTVRHSDANKTLDVYVFNNITSKNPTQIFKLTGLIKGEARISYYNSIMTAEVNPHSMLTAGKSVSQMTPDIYREFAWVKGSMTQVAFPGFFPDMTRYQAELDQASVNKVHNSWKYDAASVAKAMEAQFLKWERTVTTKVLSGGGPNDVSATVQVQEAPIQNAYPTIVVTLSRLEGNTHNMWVVIGVEDSKTLTLKNITARQTISSPVTLTGTGSAFESQIGQAVIYDQASANIGQATIHGSTAFGPGTYSTKVSYISSFNGVQEGIVTVYQDMGGLSAENETAVMVKVLVNPTPSTSIMNPAYWTQFVSAPPDTRIAESVSFGHLLGNDSWQAVVVARDILGGGPLYRDVFVFDNINATQPQLLWHESRLLHGDAKVSGYGTVMTSQVDANSSINTGKPENAWTNDLFREFKWSSKSRAFEQVVFPGMFPDMTRWQAEQSQKAVMGGQNAWMLDPVQTTQHWKLIAGTAKLVKGGGPSDLTAVVNVTYPDKGGPTTNIPITQVTLSRLGGNVNGIWEITSVSADWLFIYTPKSGTTISSPVTVTGYGPQFEAVIGTVSILDHLYHGIQVGNNFAMAPDGSSPPSKFSLDVPYTSTIKGITQEGIVQLSHASGASFARGTVMAKVLINPSNGTPIQDPKYWTQFVSAPPDTRVAESVSFGHLLGNTSLQAVVVARDILGGGPVYRDVFVFDNINATQPQLLWHESRLLHGDAKISGYDTVMMAQVDANSSINTGKPEAQLTTDLFREFKWSSGAGAFVQTAFPGFYPDMTRWQAEVSQIEVNAGKGTWRNDAVSVANRVASEFMNWQGTLTTKVLSGGGPNDVNATIQVQEAPIQSSQPTIVVTLSRLEGNTHNIWEAIAVKDGTQLTLTNIPAGSLISSPVTLTGTGAAFEAVIGQAVVYDHFLTNIGHAQITGSPGMGMANYSIQVPYTSSFKGGAQEGIVAAYHDNGGLSSGNYSAVMVKVLIGG